jgi:hypothetical protein
MLPTPPRMKTKIHSHSGFLNPRILAAFALGSVGVLLAMLSFAANPPRGMKTPAGSSAGDSAFVDDQAIPFQDNLAAPASSMPLAATGAAWSIVTSPNTHGQQRCRRRDLVAKPTTQTKTLAFADRVAYQHAIKDVYWRHRRGLANLRVVQSQGSIDSPSPESSPLRGFVHVARFPAVSFPRGHIELPIAECRLLIVRRRLSLIR